MAGRVARVHGQLLEAMHLGTVPMDDERRRAVGGRLDREREDEERRDAPLSGDGGDDESTPATIGSTTPPAMIEPISEASVPVPLAVPGEEADSAPRRRPRSRGS